MDARQLRRQACAVEKGRVEKVSFGLQKLAFAICLRLRFACIPIT
jgi:hypothetical protein